MNGPKTGAERPKGGGSSWGTALASLPVVWLLLVVLFWLVTR